MKDNNVYVDLIISACGKIGEFVAGRTERDFLDDAMVQSAVIMQLQVIGEMAKKLNDETMSEVNAPWKMIVGLRNVISHDYFALELASVWKMVITDVPDLEHRLREYLKKHGTLYIPPDADSEPIME